MKQKVKLISAWEHYEAQGPSTVDLVLSTESGSQLTINMSGDGTGVFEGEYILEILPVATLRPLPPQPEPPPPDRQ